MSDLYNRPAIFVLEDDIDQMRLLTQLIMIEVKTLKQHHSLSDAQLERLSSLQIIKIGDLLTLRKACQNFKNIAFSLVDCNIPDDKNSVPHDQFVKINHLVTGRHRSVDLISQCAPEAPITLMSSMDRFQRLVIRYYEDQAGLVIKFVSKREKSKLSIAIATHLQAYLGPAEKKQCTPKQQTKANNWDAHSQS